MITFAGVTLRYAADGADVVRDVSFDAPAGRITAVVGPNGSGKSTLVRGLTGQALLASGTISIGGDSMASMPRREVARRVAVVPQREESLFPRLVHEYVALGCFPRAQRWGPTRADPAAIAGAADRAGISHLLHRRTDELSGGEWQRTRIARALAQAARALVLDEPTTFLDVAHEMATFELLDTLARGGMAVLLVSHQLNLVARFAHDMVLLHHGRVVAAGPPATVMRGEVLEAVYGWPVLVTRDAAVNALSVTPLRNPT